MPLQLRVAAWLLCAALCTRVGEGMGAEKGETAADFLVLCRAKRAADEAVLAATGAANRVAHCRDALWQAEKEHVSNGTWNEVNKTNDEQLCASGSLPECDTWRWSAEAANGAAEVKKLAAESVLRGEDTEAREKATGELFKTTMGGTKSKKTGWGKKNAGQCLASDMMWLCNSDGNGQAGNRWFKPAADNAPCTPAANLKTLGIDESSPATGHSWKEMATSSGCAAARLEDNWHIVKTICDALIPMNETRQGAGTEQGTGGLLLVAGKLARAMEDFSKQLHADTESGTKNVHALGKTTTDQSECTGTTGGSQSSACVG
ncbi:variant surface glycoprotein (VSG), putative [Trypanosoma vivax Y486]|uniref:Variant surface glycoprotein (VSG), putative n=1 Tax=Trypanosoma vivax (strain Y486) TaxID=1055687 RepID=F9WMZ5_TRYVY|nr:variant surface glycoprotein (VSG), putative [Trypanosoma vivax Y486]|eukprot:CCD18908.1 variant surface glycoprotein (VSG), putative [Trypanosoma vivax Y486]